MKKETKEISERARAALNVAAVRMIEVAQRVNQHPACVDMGRVQRALDEVERNVQHARQEIGK